MKRKELFFSFLVVAGTLFLIELASYVAVRSLTEQPDLRASQTHLLDAHRNHRLNPEFRMPGFGESAALHSADGFRRDTPVSVAKPERTVRIIAMGTSALYGIGAGAAYPKHPPLRNDETITAFLEQSLNEQLKADGAEYAVEVINAGVSAYQTFHHVIYLNAELLDYNPDIVINIDGHNDFYLHAPTDRWNTYAYSTSILVDEFNGRTFFLPFMTFTRAMSTYSNFFHLLERISRKIWYTTKVAHSLENTPSRKTPPRPDFASNVREAGRRHYIRDLWQIHQLGKYEGFEHYVFLQPEIVFEHDHLLTESDRGLKAITLKLLGRSNAEKKQQIRELLPSMFAEHGLPFFDVSELAPYNTKQDNLYIDYTHLTPVGARLTAERIYDVLYPKVVARIASLQRPATP